MDKHSAGKEFARYASLNMLGMLGISCYILADTFFISRATGAQGLAALNLALPVYSLIHGLGLMLGMGGHRPWTGRPAKRGRRFYPGIVPGPFSGGAFFPHRPHVCPAFGPGFGRPRESAGNEQLLSPGAHGLCPGLYAQ